VKVVRIILAGQPELKATLDSPNLRQLVQRVRLRFHLGPLDRREMREYIEHRLKVGGRGDKDLIADDAFAIIYEFTGGVPRLINTLCDTALLCAFADDKKSVDVEDVTSAIEELNWTEVNRTTGTFQQVSRVVSAGQPSYLTRIEIRSEGEMVSEHMFEAGRAIVGRSPDNEIYIKSKFVSRHHAQFVTDNFGCTIEDLNSTNGVFIGESRVKKYLLKNGDVVTLGLHELIYTDLRDRGREEDLPPNKKKR